MDKKTAPDQPPARRQPRQARSQHKIELMFEAALRLLEEGDLRTLTTNAVAAKAGVSIGTLYQYFGDKQALLDALVERELGGMSQAVWLSIEDNADAGPDERIQRIIRAVLGVYGGRSRVHRQLIEHAISHSSGTRLNPLYERLMTLFMSVKTPQDKHKARGLNSAQAFVLVYSMAGVLRAYALSESPPPRQGLEDALVALVTGYLEKLLTAEQGL